MKKRTKIKFGFILEKTKTGFSAYSDELPVYTTGKNFIQLRNNILEALNYYFEQEEIKIVHSNIVLNV